MPWDVHIAIIGQQEELPKRYPFDPFGMQSRQQQGVLASEASDPLVGPHSKHEDASSDHRALCRHVQVQ